MKTKLTATAIKSKIKGLEKQLQALQAKQQFVTYLSPGTFTSESTTKPCKTGDLTQALKKMKGLVERHGATPYGLVFVDGNNKALTGMYYINGQVQTYAQIPDTTENQILRSNMWCNDRPFVVETYNSYKHTTWFTDKDFVINLKGQITRSGKDPDLVAYHKEFIAMKAKDKTK